MNIHEEVKEQLIENRKTYPVEHLHTIWWETIPSATLNPIGKPTYEFGSKGFQKMIDFGVKVGLTNLDIDYWMAIRPVRIEGESKEDFKIRSRFQQALLKYRGFIYNFPSQTPKKLKHARKQQQKQTTK